MNRTFMVSHGTGFKPDYRHRCYSPLGVPGEHRTHIMPGSQPGSLPVDIQVPYRRKMSDLNQRTLPRGYGLAGRRITGLCQFSKYGRLDSNERPMPHQSTALPPCYSRIS